ncbi:fungal-specific transcription factor domain-containing protein [Phaeosphaeria sp. MPI-PUGE-AT-0046c]|nr:fungal-specific transcription factor domain-containing protein [Phaeosphaeria sp. MPI-PUGE-AT-0046c]
MDVRWKQAPEPKRQSPPRRNTANSLSQSQRPRTANRASGISPSDRQVGVTETVRPVLDVETLHVDSLGSDEMMDLVLSSSNSVRSSLNLPTPRSLGYLFPEFNGSSKTTPEQASHGSNTSPPDINPDVQINATDYASELWNMETFWEDYLRPLPMTPLDQDRMVPESPRDREDEVERIAYLFHQQTCHTLSIEEGTDQNPWKTLIWPLAKEYPALYHAIAALTCFGISREQPQLRIEGERHVAKSTQLLSENVENGEIPLDAALAATMALGFAETWDDEASSAGLNHIRGGGILLQQLRSNQANTVLSDEAAARADFLAHTWTYMDVLARFTYDELSQPYSDNIMNADFIDLGRHSSNLDPLMGYSTTLFPTMRRVADLINKVKAREAPRNSPAIISQAIELRRAIEQWTLPVDLETIEDPSQLMTDAIQTAEAYRWATLMILYQAVPELPNLTSYGELAQKILVYIATIPLSSSTIIIHIFPLMVAGCDAVEEEDRQFVRDRWHAMSQRMVTGIVDRCLRITEEIWKRREEYLWSRGLSFTSNGRQINAKFNDATALSKDIASFINVETSPGANTASSGASYQQSHERFGRKGNDFPISAAFKKGVDMLTRSGCTEYTVRGRLHWLGVMKDWNWQVMLG